MIILIAVLLLFIVLILGTLTIILYRNKPSSESLWSPELQHRIDSNKSQGDALKKYANAMLEQLEDERRLKQEQEMAEYARSKLNERPLLPSSTNEKSKLTNVRSQRNELVPFNMTPTERALWEEFNS